MSRKLMGTIVAACLVIVACQDATAPLPTRPTASLNESEGRGFAQRLITIGTSISAGTCSDGNVASCQNMSYVAQLIRIFGREPVLPLIQEQGCKAPIASPLILFRRTSGEPIGVSDAAAICADNEPGVVLPTQNLAIPGALTGNALSTRPEDMTNAFGSRLYRRILSPGYTQVSALVAANPKFAVIELGANDIFGILGGSVIAGQTFVPASFWATQYNAVLDQVESVTKQALLVGLGRDIAQMPGVRRGSELWADRAAFLSAFNVDVSSNCDGSQNLVVVYALVPAAVGAGLQSRAAGGPPFVLSCAGSNDPGAQDRILTPAEAAVVDAQLVQMSDHVRGQAAARGYAFVELEVLYGLSKSTYSVVNQMTTATPYGPNISMDGLHPNAAGHAIIANAAARAIDDRYNIGLDEPLYGISTSPSIRTP
jgi:lysophospholipase L1-like esterase